jgi:hypothetical protein
MIKHKSIGDTQVGPKTCVRGLIGRHAFNIGLKPTYNKQQNLPAKTFTKNHHISHDMSVQPSQQGTLRTLSYGLKDFTFFLIIFGRNKKLFSSV